LNQPDAGAASIRKPSRYTLSGGATFYDNGTTAMRLPRGTIVVICGDGGCIERVVNDYGPQKKSRVVDLYRPDFFKICGCGWWAGTTQVTVYVY
jgi:3D (Asp-Asp-Asp) domain-containing protein